MLRGLILVVTAFALAANAELMLVQFIHRHGARSAITPVNESIICPGGCGLLNSQGEDQLLHVGSYLRNRYGALVPSLNYDTRVIRSRSTDIDRTLQSASALLKGLFPNTTSFVPAIHTVALTSDTLLIVDDLPAFHVPQTFTLENLATELLPQFVGLGFDATLRQSLSNELSIGGLCAMTDPYAVMTCLVTIQDIAAANNALGTLANYPLTSAWFASLNQLRFLINQHYYPYDNADPTDAARGSLGQNVVQEMLANMRQVMSGTWPTPERVMMHYSAHDTTVMPFCATLGNNAFMLPPFGQTYVLELHNESGSFFVRAVQGVPGQQPSNHSVSESDFPLHCISADGVPYTVHGDIGCLFADFERFVDSSLPQNAAGLCYVSPSILSAINCTTTDGDSDNYFCNFYRQYCPAFACPLSSFYDAATSTCVAQNSTGDGVTRGATAGISIGTAVAGLILGFVLARHTSTRPKGLEYETVRD